MKKGLIVVVGIAILASGGYAFSKTISKKKNNKNLSVVQLENGQEIKIGNPEGKGGFEREGDKADVVGKIKEINGDSIVVEQFDMSNMGAGRGEGRAIDEQVPAEKPTPTVSGEVTIILVEETSYVKGAERGMGRRGEDSGNKSEEISKSDIKEGSMVSIWTLDGGEIAERIMVR